MFNVTRIIKFENSATKIALKRSSSSECKNNAKEIVDFLH